MKLAIAISLSYSLQQNYLFRSYIYFEYIYIYIHTKFKDRILTGVSIHATSEFCTAFMFMIIFETHKRIFL
jgi:hypothetical protein